MSLLESAFDALLEQEPSEVVTIRPQLPERQASAASPQLVEHAAHVSSLFVLLLVWGAHRHGAANLYQVVLLTEDQTLSQADVHRRNVERFFAVDSFGVLVWLEFSVLPQNKPSVRRGFIWQAPLFPAFVYKASSDLAESRPLLLVDVGNDHRHARSPISTAPVDLVDQIFQTHSFLFIWKSP